MDIICYHNACPDGWTAAYIAKQRYPEAQLVAVDHGVDLTAFIFSCVNMDVLMVDFSLRTREQNDQLASLAKSFRILDHHKTAQAVLENAPYAVFDMNRSGAGLAWDYLFGKDAPSAMDLLDSRRNRPWYIDYVEDRDLWNWKLPQSKEVNAYIMTLPMTIESWDNLSKISESQAAAILGVGALAQIEHYVRDIVKQAQHGTLNLNNKRYSVSMVNAPYLNISEVGNVLAQTADIGIGWFERGDGLVQFSARSQNDIDVSEVAKYFGGGGHQHAAGFQLSLDKGRELVDTILGRRKHE